MSIQTAIELKLQESFQPAYLAVENESHNHSVPANSETHFKVTIVSAHFIDLSKVRRHQQVYQLLAEELQNGVHALALHLYHPEEWRLRGQSSPDSPACRGGSKQNSGSE
ncbi:MAG TPA: BolA family transcriptional regulator [Gammaproteobacteria bacterium]|nr:BolA family transcriptional regulator [Gammaproteobacteria bacterium]